MPELIKPYVAKAVSRKYQMPEILKESNYSCALCGSKNEVEIHHINVNRTDHRSKNLIALCGFCHRRFHSKDIPFKYVVLLKTKNRFIRWRDGLAR